MKRYLCAVALLAAVTLPAAAAGITGTWKAVMPVNDGIPRQLIFRLIQKGRTLTGAVGGPGSSGTAISEGVVNGDEFSFAVVGPRGKMICKGSVAGKDLKLVQFRDGDPVHTRELTLTRQ